MIQVTGRKLRVLVRGGGDLASGAVLRCARAGWEVIVTELAQPLAVRRTVSFSQAIYDGAISIEGVRAERADTVDEAISYLKKDIIPVLIDPDCQTIPFFHPDVLIDGRMVKVAQTGHCEIDVLCHRIGPRIFRRR